MIIYFRNTEHNIFEEKKQSSHETTTNIQEFPVLHYSSY